MDFDDLLNNSGFLILSGLGIIAVILGWIMGKKMGLVALPFWQVLVMCVTVIVAAAFFSNRD